MNDEPGALEKALERAEKAEAEVAGLRAANIRLQQALAADPLDQSMANEKLLEQVAEARAEVAALRSLLLDARDRASAFGMVDLPQDIDAALAAKGQQQ